jgi:5'-nucleotidase
MNRRHFLRITPAALAALALAPARLRAAAPPPRIVILYTNDTHSRIDPFPMDGGRYEGLGGVARRAALIKQIRKEHRHVLLLDSGDFFQGTPYFNFFGGEIELKAMSAMGYDVATLGNHEFDNGVDALAGMMRFADFEFVSANYGVGATPLERRVRPSTILQKGGVRIGVFGLGAAFAGLVVPSRHQGVTHHEPVVAARATARNLRARGCELVICLSHIGYRADTILAPQVPEIDVILGGHSHTFLDQPDVYPHAGGRTLVTQMGFAGIRLGRLDLTFDRRGRPERFLSQAYPITLAASKTRP